MCIRDRQYAEAAQLEQRCEDENDGEGKRAGDEEVARLKSCVLDFGGGQDVERKPTNEQDGGDCFGHAKLPVAQGRRAVLPHRGLTEEREINVEGRDDEQRVEQEHFAGPSLWSVEAGQEIRAATLQ